MSTASCWSLHRSGPTHARQGRAAAAGLGKHGRFARRLAVTDLCVYPLAGWLAGCRLAQVERQAGMAQHPQTLHTGKLALIGGLARLLNHHHRYPAPSVCRLLRCCVYDAAQ